MSLNYAEQYNNELIEVMIQGALTSPFITTNVRWLDAKTFHFTQMSVSGYKNHSRNGGWNAGSYAQTDKAYELTHDRDVEFGVDKADVDETNQTASIQNISRVFEQTQVVPETDALFFSKVAAACTGSYKTSTAANTYTAANVFGKLKTALAVGKLRRYKQQGALIMYVSSDIMDLLEQSSAFTRTISMTQIAEGGTGIETRITNIDGVPVMEVIDDERFYDAFEWEPQDGGFEPLATSYFKTEDTEIVSGKDYYTKSGSTYTKVDAPDEDDLADYYEKITGAHKINVLIASPLTVKTVPKINSIYFFEPGAHTKGDGYLYQNRSLSDTFVFPNGKDGAVDSVYVDLDTAEYAG